MRYTDQKIEKLKKDLKIKYTKETDEQKRADLSNKYDELNTRLIINDFLKYGYGKNTFLKHKDSYGCAKNTNIDQLWREQLETISEC